MALGSLAFVSRNRGVASDELPHGICVRGEVEWIVSGIEGEVRALADAVGQGHAESVSNTALLLRFGNSVGRFTVGGLGTLHVRCGKWDDETFDALLVELTEVALALPYAADQNAGLPHDRSLVAGNAILLHAFLYARQIVLSPKRDAALSSSMAAIFGDPHRRFLVERDRVGLADVRGVDGRSLARLAAGAEPMVRAIGAMRVVPLAKALRGHLPTEVDVPHTFHSVDTAENRFVRAFLVQLSEIVARVDALARARGAGPFWARVGEDCHDMRRTLRPMLDHDLWEGVGRFSHLPAASSVLQRRRGYRDVFRHHMLLRAATRLPIDDDDSLSRLLGMKDVAALYELWCFFAVVRALEQVLGRRPTSAERPRVDDVQVDIPWGLRVSWGNAVTVYYNLTFSQAHGDARRSASLRLRPDIAISVRSAGTDTMHVLDAKLRVERATSAVAAEDAKSFKWSDVAKMHAYRDALPSVRTAFVLYPGDEAEHFDIGGSEPGAVGAIPLVPGQGCEVLIEHLRGLVGARA